MLKRLNGEVFVGLFVLGFSIIFFVQSLKFPYKGPLGPGPGFFPLWLSGILMVLSILYMINSIFKKTHEEGEFVKDAQFGNIIITLIYMIGYVLIIPYLGFVLTSTLLLFVMLIKAYKWMKSLLISLGVSLFAFWLFGNILNVSLPVNILGF